MHTHSGAGLCGGFCFSLLVLHSGAVTFASVGGHLLCNSWALFQEAAVSRCVQHQFVKGPAASSYSKRATHRRHRQFIILKHHHGHHSSAQAATAALTAVGIAHTKE